MRRPQVQVTCRDCGVLLHGRGWPRCGPCRLQLKALRKAVFQQFEEMGRPGDWASFFAMTTGRPMPAEPSFRIPEARPIAAQTIRSIDPVFEWE